MPLKKESILNCINWDYTEVGTLLFLMGEDGLEPEDWTAEEKSEVVLCIVNAIEIATEPQHIDIANALGAIREAELRHRAKAEVAPTPPPADTPATARTGLAGALAEQYLGDGGSQIDACEAGLLAICLEHMVFPSFTAAQSVLDVLLKIMGSDAMEGEDQIFFENLARCQVAVAKQMGALSVQKGGA